MYTVTLPSDINEYPVTIEQVITQIRNDSGQAEVDSELDDVIRDATEIIGKMVGYDIVTTTYEMEFQEFSGSSLTVQKGNLKSLVSVLDANDASVAYERITRPNIRVPNKFTIEFANSIEADPLTLNFTCGWDKNNVPRGLRRMILVKSSDLYAEERGSYTFSQSKYTDLIERTLRMYRNAYS